jgi:hypothetical protein
MAWVSSLSIEKERRCHLAEGVEKIAKPSFARSVRKGRRSATQLIGALETKMLLALSFALQGRVCAR